MKYITLEGTDRTGKTTLAGQLWSKNKVNIVKDRGIISCQVYNQLFGRNVDSRDYFKLIPDISEYIIVLLEISYEEYKKRCRQTNHEIKTEEEYELEKYFYNFYFNRCKEFYTNIVFVKVLENENALEILGDLL